MKRFITYFYEYNQGRKAKNTGFARIDIRGDIVNMEVCVKNGIRADDVGNLYGLADKEDFIGIPLGEIVLRNGECNHKFSFNKNHIADGLYSLADMIGIAIHFRNGAYMASCWNDAWSEKIASGSFSVFKNEDIDIKVETVEKMDKTLVEEEVLQSSQIEQEEPQQTSMGVKIYKKIEVSQIRELPSSNWHLDTNSFLMHGICSYGFLFLKKEVDGEEEKIWLGVPGYFEKPELFMAVLFGFTDFEPIPKEVVDMEVDAESKPYVIEKNQEPKTGIFGAWFVMLDK